MNCLDCTLAGATTPAVASCHSCGAAVCADHAVIQTHYLQRVVPLNRLIPVEPPARVIACEVCAAAQHAAEHPQPAHHGHFHRRHAPAPQAAVPTASSPRERQETTSSAATQPDLATATPRHH